MTDTSAFNRTLPSKGTGFKQHQIYMDAESYIPKQPTPSKGDPARKSVEFQKLSSRDSNFQREL